MSPPAFLLLGDAETERLVAQARRGRRGARVLAAGNRLSRSAAASLLGLPAAAVAEHHRAGRAALGLLAEDSDVPRCAGWPVVSRDEVGLTAAGRDAAEAHLRLCRRCRD